MFVYIDPERKWSIKKYIYLLHVLYSFQIVKCGAIPILVKMLQKAKDDDEKINACNTLWTLAFDKETRKEINDDEFAIAELRKLVTSENSEIKRAAAGALWECEGKEKHAEGKQQSVTLQQVTGTHAQFLPECRLQGSWVRTTLKGLQSPRN